ncbi:UDP-glycosyltransferase 76E2 [Morus notabilis]|uniref:UDP-glycosyltransferase 76E2 n=1 Tax=Morus notabilis TaxID=981085 RepID=W9QE82_9ROSA|nr:UDP-glucose iridoid glucosyltransferase [Morus notabilis]EXB30471.1 UDP-glycosyltransferase 76E2 [Morus notabilis]
MGKQLQRSHRLVLVPCPYEGHLNPMLQLGTVLHFKGFSITVAHTIYNSPNPHNLPDFSFLPMPDGLSDRGVTSMDVVGDVLAVNENCREIFQRSLEKLKETQGEIISCIISDELMFFAEDVANNLKIPSIILRTTNAATSFARSGLVKLKEKGLLSQDTLSNELVPELYPLRFKDLLFSLSETLENFSAIVTKIYGKRASSAIIWNTVSCLEQATLEQIQQQCKVPIFPVGPIHMIAASNSSSLIEEDRSCLSWLDKQPHNSVIYVSNLGSLASVNEKEVTEIAWGLANSNQPFLWVIRPGSVHSSDWIELLPKGFQDDVGDKGCIVRWAPQREVLAHPAVGGFWSHCGWNSTLESLAAGVPIICKPCFGDQKVNARYVSHVWRIGLELEELKRRDIESAIRRLILHEDGKEMRARAKELKEKFEVCTRKGGSSCDSLNELVNFIMSFGTRTHLVS